MRRNGRGRRLGREAAARAGLAPGEGSAAGGEREACARAPRDCGCRSLPAGSRPPFAPSLRSLLPVPGTRRRRRYPSQAAGEASVTAGASPAKARWSSKGGVREGYQERLRGKANGHSPEPPRLRALARPAAERARRAAAHRAGSPPSPARLLANRRGPCRPGLPWARLSRRRVRPNGQSARRGGAHRGIGRAPGAAGGQWVRGGTGGVRISRQRRGLRAARRRWRPAAAQAGGLAVTRVGRYGVSSLRSA